MDVNQCHIISVVGMEDVIPKLAILFLLNFIVLYLMQYGQDQGQYQGVLCTALETAVNFFTSSLVNDKSKSSWKCNLLKCIIHCTGLYLLTYDDKYLRVWVIAGGPNDTFLCCPNMFILANRELCIGLYLFLFVILTETKEQKNHQTIIIVFGLITHMIHVAYCGIEDPPLMRFNGIKKNCGFTLNYTCNRDCGGQTVTRETNDGFYQIGWYEMLTLLGWTFLTQVLVLIEVGNTLDSQCQTLCMNFKKAIASIDAQMTRDVINAFKRRVHALFPSTESTGSPPSAKRLTPSSDESPYAMSENGYMVKLEQYLESI